LETANESGFKPDDFKDLISILMEMEVQFCVSFKRVFKTYIFERKMRGFLSKKGARLDLLIIPVQIA